MYQIKQTARKLFIIICIIGLMLTLVQCKPYQTFPQEGIWYCEELQIQICFDKDREKRNTYAIIDDEKINCVLYTDYGNRYFSIVCQDMITGKYDSADYYAGEFISFNDERIITRDTQTQTEYVFVRVPEQS